MRWRRPDKEVLLNRVFPTGKPPFDPFPTVTEVSNAYFCPLAAYYDLWYNINYALEPNPFKFKGAGDTFQQFIAQLKTSIINGERIPEGPRGIWWIRDRFENLGDQTDHRIWEFYLEPWSGRKIEELRKIQYKANIFFEVTVSSSYIPFLFDEGGHSTYPLFGRIDEIDIDGKRIIERTIKRSNDGNPPLLKDYQVWLLWKALCSVERTYYPIPWTNVDFREFELIVETPQRDFIVEKNQPEFEEKTHDAYAHIHDLAFERKGVQEAYDGRRCTYENKEPNCALSVCYFGKPQFPSSREEMKREFKRWSRALFHEIMWDRDLQLYQSTMLEEGVLQQIGFMVMGKITGIPKPNQIEVDVPSAQTGPLRVISSDQLKEFVVIPFGSFKLGLRVGAHPSENKIGEDKILLTLTKSVPISNQALIFTDNFLLFQEQPVFLSSNLQRDLFWLERRGKKKIEEANKLSPIQLLESVFGRKFMKRGGES
jgi:hypothetical protein